MRLFIGELKSSNQSYRVDLELPPSIVEIDRYRDMIIKGGFLTMGTKRIGLARIEALVENLKREVAFGAGTTLKGFRKQVVLSGGGTTTLTAADSGAYCIFNVAAASNFTLPAPKLGMHFTFIQTIINTADHVIQAATNDHGFLGGVMLMNTTADQNNAFSTATDGNNDFITLNATTTGGAGAGSRIEVVAILDSSAAKCWAVTAHLIGSGNTITPFGDAQI